MTQVSNELASRHEEIKENIHESFLYFKKNYDRFQDFLRFVFVTTLNQETMTKLAALKKPPLQFNILEAYISRQRGEFMGHEPSVTVKAADGVNMANMPPDFLKMMEALEAHLREILLNTNNDQLGYKCYTDLLAGGFSCVEIFTDHVNSMSFEQNINVERSYNPCLVGYDPRARLSHKGDGDYCFKIIPMVKEQFENEFGKNATKEMGFNRSSNFEGFKWSYKNETREIALVCEYFEKVRKKSKIVKLADTVALRDDYIKAFMKQNGVEIKQVMFKDDYNKMIELWPLANVLVMPPVYIDERNTIIESIDKITLCETGILERKHTNFEHLPLVFMDGNSIEVQGIATDVYEQVTRPMVYHARGAQIMKDVAGQNIVNEIDTTMQTKLMAALESMPAKSEYRQGYTNFQQATTVLYNAFKDGNPDVPVPPPREIQRPPTPSIIIDAFMISDKLCQTILGSYDAQQGMQGNDASGFAIQQGAMQSSAATRPYLMGYIQGLNRIAEIIVSLIPKYYLTPRTIPVLNSDGKRDYQMINDEQSAESIMMHYDPKDLMVRVEAGPSFGVQKQIAIEQVMMLMKINPKINQFVSEAGAEILLDNLDFKGVDRFKSAFEEWSKNNKQSEQQQQQLMMRGNMADIQQKEATANALTATAMSKQAEAEIKKKESEQKSAMQIAEFIEKSDIDRAQISNDSARVAIAEKEADIDLIRTISAVKQDELNAALRAQEVDAENARTASESAISVSRHLHDISMDRHNMAMDILDKVKVNPMDE